MVEVSSKMFTCQKCGIRYDTVETMEQHHREAHLDLDSMAVTIKEEIEDEGAEYVLVGRDDLEGVEIGEHHQLVQLAQSDDTGQIVFQVIEQNPAAELSAEHELHHEDGAAAETAKQAEAPSRTRGGGRKRKNTISTVDPSLTPSRPKRVVVPNIKSEFVYDTITTSAASSAIAAATAASVSGPSTETTSDGQQQPSHDQDQQEQTTYTLVQDGDVITAWQTLPDGENDDAGVVKNNDVTISLVSVPSNDQNNNQEDDQNYPSEYTPTSKVKKGRINPPKEDDSSLRRFPCPFQGCNYIAKYRSNLWDHKKTHTGEKPYVCSWPSCTMRFSQTHQLKLHLRSHTGERPYVCTWPGCNSAFSQKPGLKSHMLTHTGEKPFKCDFPGCGWSFRLKGALTDHKRAIHENAKKHVCEWPGCNKRFLQHCHLKKHIMGHADIKPFSCDWPNCNYKAVTMAYVTNHRKTHTGEKNYECTYPNCNKRFVKSSHVNRHRQRCHPDLFMMGGEESHEEMMMQEDEEEDEDQQQYMQEVVQATTSRRSRRGVKQDSGQPQILYMKAANQNGDEEDEEGATTIYIQSEDVEEEMISDGVAQFINGSVVTSDAGEQYIISTNAESGDIQATPIVIEMKEEHNDDDEVVEHTIVTHNEAESEHINFIDA